ncbi:uncharacterized protein ACA1_059790 [Acanthamoeba castellanii str. Neff]|uniref:Uncharacterized protein n=1 Tax=Acanthamoeba castellanii (strain ATCC 30010 / Neff) TaxID=1257118 RepID=L8GWF3_ACACF|nr:uncharacterized protein ACA1_059790 [Acanthamoeba castellanii str. Neff]ELR17262.1 hypothetical protein ACA1_059790 [Acanthamoeba castellanii str. Neff]
MAKVEDDGNEERIGDFVSTLGLRRCQLQYLPGWTQSHWGAHHLWEQVGVTNLTSSNRFPPATIACCHVYSVAWSLLNFSTLWLSWWHPKVTATPLAVKSGDVDTVKVLITLDEDVILKNRETCLSWTLGCSESTQWLRYDDERELEMREALQMSTSVARFDNLVRLDFLKSLGIRVEQQLRWSPLATRAMA